ncbi:PE family protein [Mycobacterium ulcerans str. Harvey]|uniref:PE family protein n=1 Tax=Mycobacterium ulcerans str. Harvey TaxID=1299332 RepID=A0ABP3ARY5_MYCUL|nr:PE family protein [Mycobacterium ulcerans str. Harvey]
MSYLTVAPEALSAATSDAAEIGSALAAANAQRQRVRRGCCPPVATRCRRPPRRCSPRTGSNIRRSALKWRNFTANSPKH